MNIDGAELVNGFGLTFKLIKQHVRHDRRLAVID